MRVGWWEGGCAARESVRNSQELSATVQKHDRWIISRADKHSRLTGEGTVDSRAINGAARCMPGVRAGGEQLTEQTSGVCQHVMSKAF